MERLRASIMSNKGAVRGKDRCRTPVVAAHWIRQDIYGFRRPSNDYDPTRPARSTTRSTRRWRRWVRKFVVGLSSRARSLRRQPDGKVLVTEAPYTQTKEHIRLLGAGSC